MTVQLKSIKLQSKTPVSKSLPAPRDIYTTVINQLAKLPVFLPTNKRTFAKRTIYSTSYGKIEIQGLTLTTSDETFFLAVTNNAASVRFTGSKEGEPVAHFDTLYWKGTKYKLIQQAGLKRAKQTYTSLADFLDVIASTSVKFTYKDGNRTATVRMPLVFGIYTKENREFCNIDFKDDELVIILNQPIAQLFSKSTAKLCLNKRNKLKPLLQAFYRFCVSHSTVFSITLKKLHSCIAPNSRYNNFKKSFLSSDFAEFEALTGIRIILDRNQKGQDQVTVAKLNSIPKF